MNDNNLMLAALRRYFDEHPDAGSVPIGVIVDLLGKRCDDDHWMRDVPLDLADRGQVVLDPDGQRDLKIMRPRT